MQHKLHQDISSNPQLSATAEIVSSYLLNHKADMNELETVIERVYFKVVQLSETTGVAKGARGSSVKIEESITPDFIVCLEDGKKLKMLKRYLKTNYNMTPEEYRRRWNLPATYPMVAPNYAKKRSQLAKTIGLGKKTSKARLAVASAKKAARGNFRMMKAEEAVA